MQMLASVGYYGFWTYYMGTGDKSTIKTVYPNVKKYIHVWKLDKEDLSSLVKVDGPGEIGEIIKILFYCIISGIHWLLKVFI